MNIFIIRILMNCFTFFAVMLNPRTLARHYLPHSSAILFCLRCSISSCPLSVIGLHSFLVMNYVCLPKKSEIQIFLLS